MGAPTAMTSTAAAVEAMVLQVNSDTVLQARAVLLGEADRLRRSLRVSQQDCLIGLCGGDPVSPQAQAGFNRRIEALLAHASRHIDELETAGHRLGDIARSYGYTETEIAASFTSVALPDTPTPQHGGRTAW